MQNNRTPAFAVLVLGIVAAIGASGEWAAGQRDRERASRGEDVTLTGKLVDLQSFMTGKSTGGDPARAAQQCIRSGVPAALETDEGLIVIGMGEHGPSRLLVPLALKHVELKGKLYEKEGLEYIDITSARLVEEEAEDAEPAEPADQAEPEEAEQPAPDEEP